MSSRGCCCVGLPHLIKHGRSLVAVPVQVVGEECMVMEGSDVGICFDAVIVVVFPTWGR